MELTTVLKNIVEIAEKIISAGPGLRNYDKGNYEFLKQEWPKLKDKIKNWEEIKFSNEDFEETEFYEKFSTICQTNMRKIVKNCKIELDEIEKKENNPKTNDETNKKPMLNTGCWLTIIGLLIAGFSVWIASIYNSTSQILETRYDQGRQDSKNELTDTLNIQQNTIQNLLDSLEKIKLRNTELEKCIKLKKTCK